MSRSLLTVFAFICIIAFCRCNEISGASNATKKTVAANTKLTTASTTNIDALPGAGGDNAILANDGLAEANDAKLQANNENTTELYKKGKLKQSQVVSKYMGQFPEGSEKKLSQEDVRYLSEWGLKVMLNEIYARHGMKFTDPMLQAHFKREKWYKGTRSNVNKLLTKIEKANIGYLKNYKYKSGVQ